MIRWYLIILLIVLFSPCEFVFDDSYDAFAHNISSRQFTSFSLFDQHYLANVLISWVYKSIQNHTDIAVLPTLYIAFNILSIIYLIWTVKDLSHKNKLIVSGVLFLLVLVLHENIISITHTRFASILSGVALINILYRDSLNTQYLSIHYLIFIFAFFTRPESAIGSFLVVSTGYLIFKSNYFLLVKRLFLPVALIVGFFSILNIHKKYTNRFEIKIEPDIEYAISKDRVRSLASYNSIEDSLKYEMALNGMFIDTSFVSVDFLREMVTNKLIIEKKQFVRSVENVWFFYNYYFLYTFLFIVFLIVFSVHLKYYTIALKIILFQLIIFLLLVYLDYGVRIADRHFIGMQTIAFIVYFLYAIRYNFNSIKMNWMFISMILFGLLFSVKLSLSNTFGNQTLVANEVVCYMEVLKDIEEVYNERVIVATNSTFHLFDKNYTFWVNNYSKNTYLIYDMSTYSIVPRYVQYLNKICDCNSNSPLEFFRWMEKNKVLFLTNDKRSSLISRYFKARHNIKLGFIDDPSSFEHNIPHCMGNSIYNDYLLKNVAFY